MAKLIMTVEQMQDEQAWLAVRNAGIGGSDIGVIMGLSPYKSVLQLWMEKTGQREPDDLSGNNKVRMGKKLEPVLAECFEEDTGLKVRRVGLLQHDDFPWAMASIDRMIVGKNELLEIKTAGAFMGKNWQGDEMPDTYYCQIQWYMFVSGCERAHVYCLIGGQEPVYKLVERNQETINYMLLKAKDFWAMVEAKVMPPIDGSEATGELLKEMYPVGNPDLALDLSGEFADMLQERKHYLDSIDVLQENVNLIENKIKARMGEAELAIADNIKISWKTSKGRVTVDSKSLQTDMPDVYNKYVKVGNPYRTFKIEMKKAGK